METVFARRFPRIQSNSGNEMFVLVTLAVFIYIRCRFLKTVFKPRFQRHRRTDSIRDYHHPFALHLRCNIKTGKG